jgi:hypothetical protein
MHYVHNLTLNLTTRKLCNKEMGNRFVREMEIFTNTVFVGVSVFRF